MDYWKLLKFYIIYFTERCCTATLFYMTTPIDTLLGPFLLTAHRAALAAVLICPESGSNLFSLTILQLIIGSRSTCKNVFLLSIKASCIWWTRLTYGTYNFYRLWKLRDSRGSDWLQFSDKISPNISLFLLDLPISIPERKFYLGRGFFPVLYSTFPHSFDSQTRLRQTDRQQQQQQHEHSLLGVVNGHEQLMSMAAGVCFHPHSSPALGLHTGAPSCFAGATFICLAIASLSHHARYFMGMGTKHRPLLKHAYDPMLGKQYKNKSSHCRARPSNKAPIVAQMLEDLNV